MLSPETRALPELNRFRGAYGRMCTLAAIALQITPRDLVERAFCGHVETDMRVAELCRARAQVKVTAENLFRRLTQDGIGSNAATRVITDAGKEIGAAVESEWGHERGGSTGQTYWTPLDLPTGKR